MESTLDIIERKERQFNKLYERMKRDEAKAYNEAYKMKRSDNVSYVDDIVNVTMNYPSTFAGNVSNLIQQAQMQTVVEGKRNGRPLNPDEKKVLETFGDIHFAMIDDLMTKRKLGKHMAYLAGHICIRGWIAGRYMAYRKDGVYHPDFVPWDMLYTAYEDYQEKLQWASYRWWRTKEAIARDYPEFKDKLTGDELIEGITWFDDEWEEVWIDKERAKQKRHGMGEVPVIIQPSSAGFGLQGKDNIVHKGESIYQFDRELYDEMNRIVTIEQTMAMRAMLAPYTHESATNQDYPNVPGQNLPVNPGETPQLVEQPDLNKGAQLARTDVLSALQQGGQNIDLGNVEQYFSAVAIAAIEEIRKKVLIPRFEPIANFKEQLFKMMVKQSQILKISGEVGLPGNERVFKREELDGGFTVRYRFMSKSKEAEIANIAIAQSAKGILPLRVIIKDIMLSQNPEEILAGLDSEKAEAADPAIGLIRLAHSCVDDAKTLSEDAKDAKLLESIGLYNQAISLLEQRALGMISQVPSTAQEKPNTQALVPLLGRGMKGNGRKPEEASVE